jgi:hypothetical protein
MKKIVRGRVENRRTPVNGRIHEAVLLERLAPRMDEAGAFSQVFGL